MTPLIQRVINDPDFPDRLNPSTVDKDGKPKRITYKPRIPLEEYYQEGEKVFANFVSSDNKEMRYVFRYGKYNVDSVLKKLGKDLTHGDFECLIVGTEFR